MKILIALLFTVVIGFTYQTKLINGYAVSLYDEKMVEENIQGKRKSKKDYKGICYSKVYIFGKILHQGNVTVKIGKSIGHKFKEERIEKNRLIIGKMITFKHYGVSKGYLQVYFNGKLLDSKTFVR